MTESQNQIFDLRSLPLRRPVLMRKAAQLLPKGAAGRLFGAGSEDDSASAVAAAVAAGAVRFARAHVPAKGVRTFVDGESFANEFESFLARVRGGELPPPRRPRPDPRSHVRRLARQALGSPPVLRLVERLCSRPEHFVKLAARSPFAPNQIPSEICGLLALVAERRPRRVLEIGTAHGGTLYLLSKVVDPNALMVTIDNCPVYRAELLRSFARGGRSIELVVGDSTLPATLERIRGFFPDGVDLLFLDGDHSSEGISRDFDLYSPLVRPGGMIVFHDIVEDNRTRYGVDTGGWTGGVPRFWAKIKQRHPHREFVRDWAQDGLGIGVLLLG